MDDIDLATLKKSSEEETARILKAFTEKNAQVFSFSECGKEKCECLWRTLFDKLKANLSCETHLLCLEVARILSRDKTFLNEILCPEWMSILLRNAGLVSEEEALTQINQQMNFALMLEAEKCLCNLVFNSAAAQSICSQNNCLEAIILRMRMYKDPEIPHDIKFFDMRLLFLITALCSNVRPVVKNDLHGLTYLTEVLDLTVKSSLEEGGYERSPSREQSRTEPYNLSDNVVELACEILKVLFNLIVTVDKNNVDEEEEAHFMRLVSIQRELLLAQTVTASKLDDLISNTVNLLCNVPPSSYEELLSPVSNEDDDKFSDTASPKFEYEGYDMSAIQVLLDFLSRRLDKPKGAVKQQNELLTPVLTVLAEASRYNRPIRKFLRQQVLPPLRDVMNRPEVGDTLRNRLCRLLTSPIIQVKNVAADFLFILCKENVRRLVKYTGYGNAAGLLASRGLMGGDSNERSNFSSESEDSDTEDFLNYQEQINPVTGCYEPPRPNPMENMTEEQKEYEANKLVSLIDQLQKGGIVQPCRIGDDGKPHPIEHVLELQESLPEKQIRQSSDDEDE